ncbi:uncharacterized protein LOC120944788 [Rana temporaria]|uniref:uncharacterized protein LOC120944788 n=1 Tax=Rana temporaria TaxID=8407 RepID=UPI001AAD1F72|nr:uncharacterized protein LOC120944788 [Rana temporaria]
MAISDAFGSYISFGSKFVSTFLLTFSLIGIQAILDSNFVCPATNTYSPVLVCFYSLSFYLCPAIIFVYLGLYYFPGFNKKKECCPCWSGSWASFYVFLELGKAPMIWLLIALADGRYMSCFVFAASHYRLDHNYYLFIFQTTGMLAITLLVIVLFYAAKCTCVCLENSRRAYEMLSDVENILITDEAAKQKAEDRQRFLCALEHNGEYMDRTLPRHMLDNKCVIISKLNPPPAASN